MSEDLPHGDFDDNIPIHERLDYVMPEEVKRHIRYKTDAVKTYRGVPLTEKEIWDRLQDLFLFMRRWTFAQQHLTSVLKNDRSNLVDHKENIELLIHRLDRTEEALNNLGALQRRQFDELKELILSLKKNGENKN